MADANYFVITVAKCDPTYVPTAMNRSEVSSMTLNPKPVQSLSGQASSPPENKPAHWLCSRPTKEWTDLKKRWMCMQRLRIMQR